MKRLTKKLLEKSTDAFIMAIEVYNKPSIQYRIEGFAFFFVNAWELLLKAQILETTRSEKNIYEKKEKKKVKKSISLRDSLKKTFKEDDLTRKNIERIAEIRDSATHFIVSELELVYSGLFQAGIINYLEVLQVWFHWDLKNKFTPGMLSLVSDLKNINPALIQKNYGKDFLEFIKQEFERAESEKKMYPDNRYTIPIEYKLVLTKNDKEGDIRLASSTTSISEFNGMLIEVPKNPSLTHPFLFRDMYFKISEEIEIPEFSTRSFTAIIWRENVKNNNKLYYQHQKSKTGFYSELIIDLIKDKLKLNNNYINETNEKYTSSLKRIK